MKRKKETFFIKFAKNILKALKIRQVRLYGSKFSKKTYTLHQHIVLLSIREYRNGMGYERFCKELPDYVALLEFLGLETIPHFTTLHKVNQRLKGSLMDSIILGFASSLALMFSCSAVNRKSISIDEFSQPKRNVPVVSSALVVAPKEVPLMKGSVRPPLGFVPMPLP